MKQHVYIYDAKKLEDNSTTKLDNKQAKIIPYKAIKDYSDLFLGKRCGHLTEYMYCSAIDGYEQLAHEEKNYYPTKSEISILEENKHTIADTIGSNCNVIEVGPGPKYILQKKVIPLLDVFKNLASYTAIDINIDYAREASLFVSERKNIDCFAYEANCTCPLEKFNRGKTCLLFLGITFSNFTNCEINATFSSFSNMLSKGEYLLFSVDCNKDLSSLKKAYDNVYVEQLTLSVMDYFKNIFGIRNFDPKKFAFEYEWNFVYNAVHLNLISTLNQEFCFNNKEILIDKNKKYHMIGSRKFAQATIDKMLMQNNFLPIKRFKDAENRIVMYLAQKQ